MGVIKGTVTYYPNGAFEIEPFADIMEFMSPDSLAEVVSGLNKNIPPGQYFFTVTVEVKRIED